MAAKEVWAAVGDSDVRIFFHLVINTVTVMMIEKGMLKMMMMMIIMMKSIMLKMMMMMNE